MLLTLSGALGRGLQSEDAVVVFARSCGSVVINSPHTHGRVSPGDSFPQSTGYGLSWDTLRPCAAPRESTSTLIIMGARIKSHGTTGGQQGAPGEMQNFSMTVHPIWGRVLLCHSTARAVAYADDAYIYDSLHSALKVFVDIRLVEDANLHMNLSKCQIYIPGVSLERAHELVRLKINQDPSLASLNDVLDPPVNVITVTGMRCVGVPIGTPEFVHAYCFYASSAG